MKDKIVNDLDLSDITFNVSIPRNNHTFIAMFSAVVSLIQGANIDTKELAISVERAFGKSGQFTVMLFFVGGIGIYYIFSCIGINLLSKLIEKLTMPSKVIIHNGFIKLQGLIINKEYRLREVEIQKPNLIIAPRLSDKAVLLCIKADNGERVNLHIDNEYGDGIIGKKETY